MLRHGTPKVTHHIESWPETSDEVRKRARRLRQAWAETSSVTRAGNARRCRTFDFAERAPLAARGQSEMARQHPDVPRAIVDKLRLVCLDLPEAYEERAWTGVRWLVAKKNFAHVVWIEGGFPPAYARAAGTDGPACVLTFRIAHPTAESPRLARAPYFAPPWFTNIVGLRLDDSTDWAEVSEHVSQSYRVLAPKKLTALLDEA